MNTVSINNSISKEFGFTKSRKIEGSRQLIHNNICYARERVYKYSGDFHCKKYYGRTYHCYIDNSKMTMEQVESIGKFLEEKLGCELYAINYNGFSFRVPENK